MHIQKLEFQRDQFEIGQPLQRALHGKTITLAPRVNVISGPNASGKSALLRVISGVINALHTADTDQNVRSYSTLDQTFNLQCTFKLSPDWPAHGRNHRIQSGAAVL